MDSAAVNLSGDWDPANLLEMTTGIRYSRFRIKLPANEIYDAVKLTPANLTGNLHLILSLRPNLKLVSNIGRGFRPPNIFDLATLGLLRQNHICICRRNHPGRARHRTQ